MKKTIFTLMLLTATCIAFAGGKGKKKKKGTTTETEKKMELKNENDSLSYALGISIATNLKSQGVDSINSGALGSAVGDVFDGNDSNMTVEAANEILNNYFGKMAQKKAEGAKSEGVEFLKANSTKEGVVVTPSGLQYKVVTMGTGPKPTMEDKVTTHYHGMLVNGKVFDSSVQRGQPASFPVGGVIKGWQEGLQLMPVGSKFIFYVPSDLAYGDRGAGQDIPPHAALIFEVELLKIDPK